MNRGDYERLVKLAVDGDQTYFMSAIDEAIRRSDYIGASHVLAAHPDINRSVMSWRFHPLFGSQPSIGYLISLVGDQTQALKLIGKGRAPDDGSPPGNLIEFYEMDRYPWLFPAIEGWGGYDFLVVDGDDGGEVGGGYAGLSIAMRELPENLWALEETLEFIAEEMGYYPGWTMGLVYPSEREAVYTLMREEVDDDGGWPIEEESLHDETHIITITRQDGKPLTERERKSLRWGA